MKKSDRVRDHLHQASPSMPRQLYDDASDSVLIEHNGVTPDWGCNTFSSNTVVFKDNRITSVMAKFAAALMLTLSVNGA